MFSGETLEKVLEKNMKEPGDPEIAQTPILGISRRDLKARGCQSGKQFRRE
jgi:hypothetical protein